MFVLKRDSTRESVKFDKITARIQKLSYGLEPSHVDPILVAKKVIDGVYDGVTTSELDNLAAETAAGLTSRHPDYAQLASRIAVSNLHKNTIKSFSKSISRLSNFVSPGKLAKVESRAGLLMLAPLVRNSKLSGGNPIFRKISPNKEALK